MMRIFHEKISVSVAVAPNTDFLFIFTFFSQQIILNSVPLAAHSGAHEE